MRKPLVVATASAVLFAASVLLIGIGGINGVVWLVVIGAVVAGLGTAYQVLTPSHDSRFERPLPFAIIDVSAQGEALRLSDRSSPVGRFIGREWLLDQVDQWLASSEAGYLVIRAEAGIGKSALAYYLASSRDIPIHMTRASGEGRKPAVARLNLGAQLIQQWNLSQLAPGGELAQAAGSVLWLEQVVEAAANKAKASKARKVVFVVDGLDEAFPSSPAEATGVPLGLPAALPAGCLAVVTSRPGVSIRTADAGSPPTLAIDVEGDDNARDLRRYLERAVSEPPIPDLVNESSLDASEVVDYLCQCAAGVWIYATTVLEDIAQGHSAVDGVRTLPPSLVDYYDVSVTRWQRLDDWSAVGLPVLATCVASGKPLSLDELATWAGDVPRDGLIRWVNGPLRAFLAERAHSASRAYEIRHESFREFVARRPTDDVDDAEALARAEQLAAAVRDANGRVLSTLLPPLEP